MKQNASRFPAVPSFLKSRVNLFYILALVPLLLISYYNAWDLVIAFYGFVFLLLKSDKLSSKKEANLLQRILGLIILVSSFFVYYGLVLIFPTAGVYGGANYVVFLFGLFLIFFDSSALREAFASLFFITAAISSSLVAAYLKPYFSPYLYSIANLIADITRLLGVNAEVTNGSEPIIGFTSLSGRYVVAIFAYECLGVFSAIVFSILLIIVLYEDPSSWKTRLLASIIGILGTFALNILRVTIIFVTDYFYGAEAGASVHYVIGYALFSAWLILFLYAYSKREGIISRLWRRKSLARNQPRALKGQKPRIATR